MTGAGEGAVYGAGVADEGERLSGAALGGTIGLGGGAAMSKIGSKNRRHCKKLIKKV
ncbi:MAG: hypothetical protein CM15mV95_210 [Caudoviricetes sp.]|nr:MAG: hypothetical protein CM15mV95_210 [Caudoviricetes sp.]